MEIQFSTDEKQRNLPYCLLTLDRKVISAPLNETEYDSTFVMDPYPYAVVKRVNLTRPNNCSTDFNVTIK